jgi:DHA3 family macrolide efflux protein-like MFS transporter
MVPKEHFARIQGINQTLNGGLNIISAPLGALLLEVLPMQGILAIDVVSALFAILPLFFISIPQPERIESGESIESSVWQDVKVGFQYVLDWPGMLILIGMAMMINFLLTPAGALMPLLVTEHFKGGVIQLGWLEATFGIGVIIGGIGLGVWGGFKRRVATAMFGVTGLGTGFIILGVLPGSGFYLALGAVIIAGIMIPIANGAIGAIFQAAVPPEMQGRVFTLVGSGASAMAPVGLIFGGPVADAFGVQSWFLIGGLVCTTLGIVGFFLPALMNIDQESQEKSEVELPVEQSEAIAAD